MTATKPMSATAQQKRRRELHAMPIADLQKLYANRTGRLLFEVRKLTDGLSDGGRQILVDAIVAGEARR
jgi:hypothetical protein